MFRLFLTRIYFEELKDKDTLFLGKVPKNVIAAVEKTAYFCSRRFSQRKADNADVFFICENLPTSAPSA